MQSDSGFIYRPRHAARRNIRLVRGWSLLVCATVLSMSGGCRSDGRLSVSPVNGKVVYKGQGVPNATVIFFPVEPVDEKAKKMRPFAYADGEGRFELKTYVGGDGAPPGKYRVSIIASAGGPPSGNKDRPANAPTTSPSASAVRIPPTIIKKYANVDTAGIEVDIVEGENKLEPFVLTM